MVIGGEERPWRPKRSTDRCFNGAADGDRRRATAVPFRRFCLLRRFNGAADGDRRRGALWVRSQGAVVASTEPPMVIGGELLARGDHWPLGASLQRSRRW